MMIRELCYLEASSKKIGGAGKIVEIDESKYGKRKYNRGARRDGKWVFGAIERRENKRDPINVVLFVVADRTAETLLSLINKHIEPGTTIYSDCWASYSNVQRQGYQHQTVNHSVEFRAEDGTCTNMIEGCWKHSKRLVGSGKKKHLASYLGEFCWRKSLPKDADIFLELLALIRKFYDGEAKTPVLESASEMGGVYTIHQRGQEIPWDEYVRNLAEMLNAYERETESEVEDADLDSDYVVEE
jgi:transposase-like protein